MWTILVSFCQWILQEKGERKYKYEAIKTIDPLFSENNKTTLPSTQPPPPTPTPTDPTLEADIQCQQMKDESVVLQFIQSFSIQLLSTLQKADLAVAQMSVYRIAP